VRIVIPTSPGGILDAVMRLLSPKLGDVMGQNIVLDNRAGASTIIGTEIVAHAAPNGYTLLTGGQPLTVNPSLHKKLPYDWSRDLAPLSLLVSAPYVLVVHPSVAARTVQELVALAPAKPGAINNATRGNGTKLHNALALLKNLAGIDLAHVPYRGGGLALAAVVSGEAGLTISSIPTVLPHMKTGRLRALAITSVTRSPVLPDLPTIRESGVPEYEFSSWAGLLAPAGTPPATLHYLNASIVKAMHDPALTERFAADGMDVIASSEAEFAAHLRRETARWAKVVKQAGIRGE
jgi:tripartite-type tricarboxylate transporter receptor subunit TctC